MIILRGLELMTTGVDSNAKVFCTGCKKSKSESLMASTLRKGETLKSIRMLLLSKALRYIYYIWSTQTHLI